jgi:hypothetical protein
MIITTTFQRKTFVVQAIQITGENLSELAEWCGGELIESYTPEIHLRSGNYRTGHPCIEMTVGRNGQKIRAFIGDWITHIQGSEKFKIYRDKTFKEAFEEVLRDFPEEMMRKVVREELRSLLYSLTATARDNSDGLAAYEVGELERAGHRAIQRVMEIETALLPHAWNCNFRDPAGYDSRGNKLECSCGVGDDK